MLQVELWLPSWSTFKRSLTQDHILVNGTQVVSAMKEDVLGPTGTHGDSSLLCSALGVCPTFLWQLENPCAVLSLSPTVEN